MAHRAIVLLLPAALLAADNYLFTSFRGNGESGVYFALSSDGYRWTPAGSNQPVVRPRHPGMLMRDPCLVLGPDKRWHLLWTTGWTRASTTNALTIGYSSSPDLVSWSEQKLIPIPLETARNAWAPEMVWDRRRGEWIIFWASTIPGRFQETATTGDNGYNHRIWSMRTRDFQAFSQPELFFDPGFNCIDSTITRIGRRWLMVFKDERKLPLMKNLRLAWAGTPVGPWQVAPESFTESWAEGPTVIKLQSEWLVLFDHYSKPQHYGAYRTRDWRRFEDVTASLSFPEGARHGTAVRITAKEAERLRAWR